MSNPKRWEEVSPHLDRTLTLPEDERRAWVAFVHGQDPHLGGLLESLLHEYRVLSDESFLERRPIPAPAQPELAGQKIGVYTLVSNIGRGGMGSVWLAERTDGQFDRQVAIKFLGLLLPGQAGERRFRREGKVLGMLVHPHIAQLSDAGISSNGQPYLVLEYVQGEHIDQYCDERALDIKARIRLFLDVLDAVSHAHSNLIVHRDIKPPNVLVRTDGEVKLLDFGIAKLLDNESEAEGTSALTIDSGCPITPEYAAPEQLSGGAITTGTDVYALGALLYLLLTGEHPAGTAIRSHADLVRAIVETDPARPSETMASPRSHTQLAIANAAKRGSSPSKLHRMLSGDLDTIALKALKKDPQERYLSVRALADDLRRYLDNQPISARAETMAYRTRKFVRRNRLAVSLATLAFAVTVSGLIGTLMLARSERSERDFALRQMARSAALNEFHHFLLSDAAPSGKPLKTGELLDRAEKIIARQHAADDPNRIELMLSVGRQYLEQDDGANSRRLLNEAYRLSRGVHDSAIRSEASCTLASSLARDEQLSRAEELFQQGLRELPAGPQFALERIDCLQNGFEVAEEKQDVWKGIAFAEAAQKALRESPFDSEAQELGRWLDLGTAYGAAGKDVEALAAFDKAAHLLSSLGRDKTAKAAALFNEWGLRLEQLGRPVDAERMYRRAIDITRLNEKDEAVSPVLLNNYARSLRELGQLNKAAEYAERSYREAQAVQQQMAINQSLFERARIYTAQGNLPAAMAMVAEVEPRLRQMLPAGHYAFATLAMDQAYVALLKGDTTAAFEFAKRAVSLDEIAVKAGRDGPFHLSMLLARKAAVELEAQRPDLAIADASHALRQMDNPGRVGRFSSYRGRAYLTLGRALLSQANHDEAVLAFKSAAEQLRNSLGEDHPETRTAERLVAEN